MRLKQITEEFADYVKNHRNKPFPIFINPTRKEILELAHEDGINGVRVIVDANTKTFYIFSENVYHAYVAKKYNIVYHQDNVNALFAEAEIDDQTGKIIITDSNLFHSMDYKDYPKFFGKLQQKWGWAEKYSNIIEFLKTLRDG